MTDKLLQKILEEIDTMSKEDYLKLCEDSKKLADYPFRSFTPEESKSYSESLNTLSKKTGRKLF
jgi:phosphoenolpyruvate carboxylase